MQSFMMVLRFGSNMRMSLDTVNKRELQDQVSSGLILVVHLGCSGCLMFCRLLGAISQIVYYICVQKTTF